MWEKEKNAGFQHFSPFPTMFSNGLFYMLINTEKSSRTKQPTFLKMEGDNGTRSTRRDRNRYSFPQTATSSATLNPKGQIEYEPQRKNLFTCDRH